jgi:predicted PurR-regulated permease PerM
MKQDFKFPFYAKVSLIFIGLFAFVNVLYITQHIIVPIICSIIIAILLSPIVDFFVRKKINRILAIVISLLTVSLVLISLILLLFSQLSEFSDAFPKLVDKFYEVLNNLIAWSSDNFNISTKKINAYINDTKTEILSNSRSSIAITINKVTDALVVLVLIPVYIFMMLLYEALLLDFIRRLFGQKHRQEVNEILSSTRHIIQKYLIGLLIEASIIATLNSVGLLIIGIEYAVVLGIIGAILNIIPYLGSIIAMGIYVVVALVTKGSASYIIYVLILYAVNQFIDNNFIVPKLIGSQVKINALVAIIAVIAGGALWGVAGMFLSLPLTAVAKLIFDRVEPLKPWGFLLGDTMPKEF